jgi:hypothetical protein
MVRYPLNGRPTAFFRGDWYVGKGVACARIRYGAGLKDVVEVFTTHVSEACLDAEFSTDAYSSMPRTRRNLTIHISAIGQLKHGKSQS